MNHLSDATLALYAGNDLPWLAGLRAARHVARCEQCRREVEAYSDLRAELPALADPPELPWNRLAAEMKANIRLGLAAGECVRQDQAAPAASFSWLDTRATVAYASIAALVTASVLLVHPAPRPPALASGEVTLQATAGGIEWKGGGQALSLLHRRAGDDTYVTYSVSAQGSMRARYVDSETDQVTINSVYEQ